MKLILLIVAVAAGVFFVTTRNQSPSGEQETSDGEKELNAGAQAVKDFTIGSQKQSLDKAKDTIREVEGLREAQNREIEEF